MKGSGDGFVGKNNCVWVPSTHTHEGPSRTQELSSIGIHLQRFIFSSGVSLCVLTMYKGRPQAQQQMANTNPTQWYFCVLSVSYCFVWAVFCLPGLLVYNDFQSLYVCLLCLFFVIIFSLLCFVGFVCVFVFQIEIKPKVWS